MAMALVSAGCGPRVADQVHEARGVRTCAALDSTLVRALPPRPWTLRGKATFDVDDYRVRGHFRLTVSRPEQMAFEFEGTTLFGGHREDIAVSLEGDTLRLFDRERGAYYEGAAVDDLIERGTNVRGDWKGAVREAVGFPCSCDGRSEMTRQGDHVSGLVRAGAFVLTLDAWERVLRASWPDPTGSATYSDRLDVRYEWDGARLRTLTIRLPVRGWRIRLETE